MLLMDLDRRWGQVRVKSQDKIRRGVDQLGSGIWGGFENGLGNSYISEVFAYYILIDFVL